MKKLLIYMLPLFLGLAGCTKKTDLLFDGTADERLTKALDGFQTALSTAPGWKLFVYPKGLESQGINVGGLTYYMKFTADNRVTMISDFTQSMADTAKESSYRLKAVQRPSLIFDTYSYIHVAADPQLDVSLSPTTQNGYGWGTDFDFSFTTATPSDTLVLEGNFNHSNAYLIKISQEETDDAFSGGLGKIVAATNQFAKDNLFLFFPGSDGNKIGIAFNFALFILNFNYLDAGNQVITISAPFSRTTTGVHFEDPVTVGGHTFQDLIWDPVLKTYYIDVNGTRVNITNSSSPIIPFDKVLGTYITTIYFQRDSLPGQSASFREAFADAQASMKTSYGLTTEEMDFTFDAASHTMIYDIYISRGGTLFRARFQYSYAANAQGTIRFTRTAADANAAAVESDLGVLLEHIENDGFKIDYFPGDDALLAQFTSVNDPDFFFTGNY
jgi:Domain of unknown function (DUF4302)